MLDEKLMKERLYRYIGLEELINVTNALAANKKGSKEFFKTVEGYVIKHRLGLSTSMIQIA